MQRRVRITLALVATAGALALGAGTAFADDNSGPINYDNQSSPLPDPGKAVSAAHVQPPTLNGQKLDAPKLPLGG
jgi:hypothetical protein